MKHTIALLLFVLTANRICAQGVKIGAILSAPDGSSMLDVESTSKGFLPPRMSTAERDAIVAPAEGLMIYNTTTKCTNFFIGSNWQEVCGSCTPLVPAPAEGIHLATQTSIEWHWIQVAGAQGYRFNTTNNYETATDAGNTLSYTQNGLNYSTPYTLYVWAYNVCGGSLNSTALHSVTSTPPCAIGSIGPGGGRVFYCGNAYPGKTGLEAAPSDQSAGAPWGCQGSLIPGADGATVGSGIQNTADILAVCSSPSIAARLCENLDLSGFTDWFLPSGFIGSELSLMYTNLHAQGLGGFSNSVYWSSTERDSQYARLIDFNLGEPNDHSDKNANFRVRCVRAF
jgi:hypothetical protein